MATFWTSILGSALISITVAQNILTLQLNKSLPATYSDYINPSFAGFGIEPSNLFSFTGYDTPNELTFNLIGNLQSYAGAPPHIRIGGNTQDNMIYSASQTQWTYINNPNPVGQGVYPCDSMLIGPNFFKAANRFPKGTPVTWGLNMAYQQSDYIARITQMANLVITQCTNLNLVGFEIGNEPDLYLQNQFRSGTWGGPTYIQQWLDRASAIYQQVLSKHNLPSNFFEPAATASTIGTTFQIQDLMSYGIGVTANDSSASYISTWNQHDYYYYIGVSSYPLTLYHFMTLSTTTDQFVAWVAQNKQAQLTPYPYALREMGVVGPIGLEGITNTFGAALWALNFLLYTASLNISSVQLHMTDNSNASAWQPINVYGRQPFVRPIYYGIAAFDQIIGPSCQAQISQYFITGFPTNYGGRIATYSVYQAGQLASIVVINSMMANITDAKQSVTVQLNLGTALAGQVLHLASLTNTGADATSGTTWNGISYERSGNGNPTVVDSSDPTVTIASDGSATFTVRDSQAIVANLGSKVGNVAANSAACAALASRSGQGGSSVASASHSSTSSNAASSIRQGGSTAGSSASATATVTNGVKRITSMIFSVFGIAVAAGLLMVWR